MQPSSSPQSQPPYPKCPNGNQSRSVCLSQQCQAYPFYCAVCAQQLCQIKHLHGAKIVSTGFREFMKKIKQYSVPRPQLAEICEKYKQSLEKLRTDINTFVQRQLFEIEKLLKESVEFPEGEKTIVRRIIDREYQTLKGFEMDVVWSRVNTEAEERLNQFANEIAYIKMKTEEINEISADFQKVITLIDGQNQEKGEAEGSMQSIKSIQSTQNMKKQGKEEPPLKSDRSKNASVRNKKPT